MSTVNNIKRVVSVCSRRFKLTCASYYSYSRYSISYLILSRYPLLGQERSVRQEQIEPEAQPGEVILVKLFLVVRSKLVSCGLTRDNGQFMSVDESPRACKGRVLRVPVEKPDEGNDEGVVRPRVA